MARLSRKIVDLPGWFDLKKYRGIDQLTAVGWYDQLAVRQMLYYLVDLDSLQIADADAMLESIRQQPIVNCKQNVARDFISTLELSPRVAPGLRTLTDRDLQSWADPVEQKKLQLLTRLIPLVVNLALPDSRLREDFAEHIKGLRKKMPDLRKPIKRLEFDKWRRYGVLPYLDLLTWEIENDARITNPVKAEAIMPRRESGDEIIRKTTASLAKKLLWGSLDLLRDEAAKELR